MSNKRALITGVAGQAGSYLADYLLSLDYEVIGMVRRSATAYHWRLSEALKHPKFILEEADITDLSSLIYLFNRYRPHEVYNLAAQSHVWTSFRQPNTTWDITGQGGLNVLEALRMTELIYTSRLYQASSSEMFGLAYSYAEDGTKIQNFDTPFMPQSPYSCAKLAVHHMVRVYRQSYKPFFGCCGVLFNMESPRRGSQFVTRKITKYFFDRFCGKTKDKLKLGNLNSYRDWGYSKEYVTMMHAMLQKDKPQDYIICTGETHSIDEFLNEVGHLYNINPYHYIEHDKNLERPSEVDFLRGDYSRASLYLGWKPQTTFRELVAIMVNEENGLD